MISFARIKRYIKVIITSFFITGKVLTLARGIDILIDNQDQV